MATLYWGGGSGTWDSFTTGKWYTDFARTILSTRAPSSQDDVIFDSASNATSYTVTLSALTPLNFVSCKSWTVTGPASGNVTFAGSIAINLFGNLTWPATGMIRSFTGGINCYGSGGTQNITTNGLTIPTLTVLAINAGTVKLLSALTIQNGITVQSGTFDTNNQTVTSPNITVSAPATSINGLIYTPIILNFGTSTLTITTFTGTATAYTVNGGSSTINISSTSPQIGTSGWAGGTFGAVNFTAAGAGLCNIYGSNTFTSLTFAALTTPYVVPITCYGNQTITGALTINASSSVYNRRMLRSDITGTPRTFTVGTFTATSYIDFKDIVVAGASAPWSGTSFGDCGGNTNITFPAAKTVYWAGAISGLTNWGSTSWAATSGGAVSTANFPLAQDSIIFDDAGTQNGSFIVANISTALNFYNVKNITATNSTASATLTGGGVTVYGDANISAGLFAIGSSFYFAGRTVQTFTSGSNSVNSVYIAGYGTNLKLGNNLTVTNVFGLISGGLDTNNYNLILSAATGLSGNVIAPFAFVLGSSTITSVYWGHTAALATGATVTCTPGTSTINLTATSSYFGWVGQTASWNNVAFTSTLWPELSLYGTNSYSSLTFAQTTLNNPGIFPITVYGNQTVSGTLALGGGISAVQRIALYSNTPGTQRTISAGTVTGLTDVDIRDIQGAGTATWSGTRLGDCQGNSGITFDAAKTVYWTLSGTNNWAATSWATTSGGTPAVNNFPLAQDTAVVDNVSASPTITVNLKWNIGTYTALAATSTTPTLNITATSVNIYGNIVLSSFGGTISGGSTLTFFAAGTTTITPAGNTITASFTVNNPNCTVVQNGAASYTGNISVLTGNYRTQNYNLTPASISSLGSAVRSIDFGTSAVSMAGNFQFTFASAGNTSASNLTFTGANSTITLTAVATKSFNGGGKTFGTVNINASTSTSGFTISNDNTFNTLNVFTNNMAWQPGQTQTISTLNFVGILPVSGGSKWYSAVLGNPFTYKAPTNYVGSTSVDQGDNSGLSFTDAPGYTSTTNPIRNINIKDVTYVATYYGGSNFFAFF